MIQTSIEPKLKKVEMVFQIENAKQFDCQAFDIGSTLEISKSVCINNHIKEMFTVQLTTDMWLSSS